MSEKKTLAALGATLLLSMTVLAGCGGDDSSAGDEPGAGTSTSQSPAGTPTQSDQATSDAPAESPTESPTKKPTGTTIDITIKGGKVDPNGERVKAKVGKPITLNIDAEKAGELHVHATPEQEIEFPAGKSTKKLTIDQPGIVDVEDHELEQVIVQLQVS